MKMVVLDGYTLNPGDISWEELEKFGVLKIYDRTTYGRSQEDQDLVTERIIEADIVFTNKTPITRSVLKKAKNLKYIGVLATGYDVVDIEAAKEMDIVVTNIPTYGTASVSQMTFALLLELCHHVGDHSTAVFNGEWTNNPDWSFWKHPLIELEGKTIGIVGYGKIGQAVSNIAQAFGMKVIAYDNHKDSMLEHESVKYGDLETLLANADVVSLHCPLTEVTAGIINQKTIRLMKKNALLINTSRGPLVDEVDLAKALNGDIIAGAALDVVSEEPIKAHNPLLSAKNCVITPHISWAPKESRERLLDIAIDNLKAFLKGHHQNRVNS